MLSKKKIIETIQDLPDNVSIEEIFERLILLQKIETGIDQSNKGKTKSTAEAKERLKKYFQVR